MPNWLIKSALQRTLSWLPASHKWNELFQRYVTRSLDMTAARFDMRLDCCRRHLDSFLELRPNRAATFTALEIGTGWYPVVPIGLYLCGAQEVWSYDIAPLLSATRLQQTLTCFAERESSGALQKALPGLVQRERLAHLRSIAPSAAQMPPDVFLEKLKIHALVRDAQQTGLSPGKVDLFASTGVLEYIPPQALKNMLLEFKRVGSPDAVQSHYLNLIDQYWYFDRSITPFNFLKYSTNQWKYLNSPLTWLNRLRISDYRALFAETGYQITKEINTPGSRDELLKIRLAPEFQTHTIEDLLVLYSWLIAKPAGT